MMFKFAFLISLLTTLSSNALAMNQSFDETAYQKVWLQKTMTDISVSKGYALEGLNYVKSALLKCGATQEQLEQFHSIPAAHVIEDYREIQAATESIGKDPSATEDKYLAVGAKVEEVGKYLSSLATGLKSVDCGNGFINDATIELNIESLNAFASLAIHY